jgi:N6-L-threonylcarbamoyladenine synthase
VDENLNDICASIQHTIIEILMDKLKLAVKKQVLNRYWRGSFGKFWNSKHLKNRKKYGWKTFIPKFEYTTDNAMIGIVGYQKFYHNNLKLPLLFLKLEYKYKLCNYFTIRIFRKLLQHLL